MPVACLIAITDLSYLTAGASWGQDDSIVFADLRSGGLLRVSADGGTPETLTTPDSGNRASWHRLPRHLPGARDLLFSVRTGDGWSVAILSLESREWRSLGLDGTDARYVDAGSSGYLLYQFSGELFAISFSLARGEITGTPIPVLSDVMVTAAIQSAFFSVSDTGLLAFVADTGGTEIARIDREGNAPDGSLLAVCQSSERGVWDVRVLDLERGSRTLLAPGGYIAPVWTPDGERVAFSGSSSGTLHWAPADGSEEPELLFSREHQVVTGSFHPNGNVLAFYEVHPSTRRDLYVLDLGDGTLSSFLMTSDDERAPAFSPDGRFIAYDSDESGRYEVYVRPYPGPGRKWIASTDGGRGPKWSTETGELFYWEGSQLMAVSVETEPEFEVGRPYILFRNSQVISGIYDVAPDAQSFFVTKRTSAPKEVRVIFNWFQELERLAPADN